MPDQSPSCGLCSKPIGGESPLTDKRGRVFHRQCIKDYQAKKDAAKPIQKLTPIDSDPTPLPPSSPPTAKPPSDFCPKCGAVIAASAVLCVSCGYNRNTGKIAQTKNSRPRMPEPILEFVLFGFVFGLLLLAPSILILSTWNINTKDNAAVLWLFASIAAIPGLITLLGGLITLWKRNGVGIALCVVGTCLMPVFYYGPAFLLGVPIKFNCMLIIMIGIPLIVFMRISPALEEVKAQKQK